MLLMSDNEPNISLRLKGDQLVLKLGDQTKVLNVTNDVTDEVTHLARTLLARRQEIHDKRRRETIAMYREADNVPS
jgi:hypothetical protein